MLNKTILIWLTGILFLSLSCSLEQQCDPPDQSPYFPSEALGGLFHDVQMSGIFEDSKTFVDYVPRCDPSYIASVYKSENSSPDFDLGQFVFEYFYEYTEPEVKETDNGNLSMESHLKQQWDNLTRPGDTSIYEGSLLPLPHSYVVPGGRFREIYYWDSYFTMLGLAQSDKLTLIKNMVDNFAYLIDKHGHIPNGNRTYYLSRSQPPYFSLMVNLLAEQSSQNDVLKYLPALEKEYKFWMEDAQKLTEKNRATKRVVLLNDIILNRYWDNLPIPRPESHKEDFQLAETMPSGERIVLLRNLKAGAESGWDFSSRWFKDLKSLKTIDIVSLLPVDLNCLLYNLERTIAELYELKQDHQKWTHYHGLAEIRKKAINEYFWNENRGIYSDYNFINGNTTSNITAAVVTPLFFNIADDEKAQKIAEVIKEDLLLDGGMVTTMIETGQQWDYPNGWAPLQWIAIKGLLNYKQNELAFDIASRWTRLNRKVYQNTGKMMEKYNVADTTLTAGGGEYPLQDGFGWTNGVALQILATFPELSEEPAPTEENVMN